MCKSNTTTSGTLVLKQDAFGRFESTLLKVLVFLLFASLPVVGGEEKRWHEAPKNIVEGKSKIPSVRQWQWDNCHTAHTDHCDNGVEDELK